MVLVLQVLVLGALAGWVLARVFESVAQRDALLQISLGILAAVSAALVLGVFRLHDLTGFLLYGFLLVASGGSILLHRYPSLSRGE